MGDKSSIEWTDATWNPVVGCSRVSEGCRHCYAEVMAARLREMGQSRYAGLTTGTGQKARWTGEVRLVPEALALPLRWKRPRRIFVNSMSDLFHESLSNETIAAVFGVMAAAPQHTFQLLTKRPERASRWFGWLTGLRGPTGHVAPCDPVMGCMMRAADRGLVAEMTAANQLSAPPWPLPNVWLGVSVEDQKAADERIPHLLQCPAAVRWISAEPLLGPVDFTPPKWRGSNVDQDDWLQAIDWVVVGGESGPGARPMLPTWARGIRDACICRTDMGRPWPLPFLFKQWGAWAPHVADGSPRSMLPMECVGKKAAGRELDGRTWDEFPSALGMAGGTP